MGLKLVIKKNRIKKDGTTPIYIQYAYSRNSRTLLPTRKNIEPKYWNVDKGEVRRNVPESDQINDYLKTLLRRVDRIIDDAIIANIDPGTDLIKEKYNNQVVFKRTNEAKDLIGHLDHFIEDSKIRVVDSVIKDYNSLKKHLSGFQKKTNRAIHFTSIDYKFYQSFLNYLTTDVEKPNGEVGLATNSAGKQIKNLKAFYKNCIKQGITPFKDLSFLKVVKEESDSIYLNEDEVKAIMNVDLDNRPELIDTRDMFVIGCETGLRYSDYSRLNQDHVQNGFIKIRNQKTNVKVVIPISDRLRSVLNRRNNNFPKSVNNQNFNKEIKEVGELAGISDFILQSKKKNGLIIEESIPKYKLISSHTCRRSFCTNQFLNGTPSILIRKISGHKTEVDFLKYIKIDEEKAADKMLEVWKNKYM